MASRRACSTRPRLIESAVPRLIPENLHPPAGWRGSFYRGTRGCMEPDRISTRAQHEDRWRRAIYFWENNSTNMVLRLLAGDRPIPQFARQWLAEALLGKVKRKRGPKPEPGLVKLHRFIHDDVIRTTFQQEKQNAELRAKLARLSGIQPIKGTPTEQALEAVADEELSPDAVSRIVFRRKARIAKKSTP